VTVDSKGEPTSKVRRITPERGRAVSFDLAAAADGRLVVLVQDEAASMEGAGARVLRYVVDGDKVEATALVESGVGSALAELVPSGAPGAGNERWFSWSDTSDRARLLLLGPELAPKGRPSLEPALDGMRILSIAPPSSAVAVTLAGAADATNRNAHGSDRPELVRFGCP
jgi:hypothetical protein